MANDEWPYDFGLLNPEDLTRDQRIVTECEQRGEPYFVLRAKDAVALDALDAYAKLAIAAGSDGTFVAAVDERVAQFAEWRAANPELVKVPDLRPEEGKPAPA